MCGKIFTIIILLIAIVMAVLGSALTPEHIDYVIIVSKFFDIMLPILAVGALIKYLWKCPRCCNCSTKCAPQRDVAVTREEVVRSGQVPPPPTYTPGQVPPSQNQL